MFLCDPEMPQSSASDAGSSLARARASWLLPFDFPALGPLKGQGLGSQSSLGIQVKLQAVLTSP